MRRPLAASFCVASLGLEDDDLRLEPELLGSRRLLV
jgi:hypothetical protein